MNSVLYLKMDTIFMGSKKQQDILSSYKLPNLRGKINLKKSDEYAAFKKQK